MQRKYYFRVFMVVFGVVFAGGVYRSGGTPTDLGGSSAGRLFGCSQEEESTHISCWQGEMENILKTKGMDAALTRMGELYGEDLLFAKECHSFAHRVGESAYEEFIKSGHIEVSEKLSYCAFGLYHGFMESLLQKSNNLDEAREFCAYVSQQMKDKYHIDDACYHGVGHGVVDGSDPRAFGDAQAIIDPGLDLCDKIATSKAQLKSCATGVFNSLAIMQENKRFGLLPERSDPYKICSRQNEPEFQRACYEQMNTVALNAAGRDFKAAVGFIELISRDDYALYALRSLAANAAVVLLEKGEIYDVSAFDACRSLSWERRAWCIEGIAGGFMEHGKPNEEYARAMKFCSLDGMDDAERGRCFHVVFEMAQGRYDEATLKTLCSAHPDVREEVCDF